MENKNQPAFPTHHNGHVGGLTKRELSVFLNMAAMVAFACVHNVDFIKDGSPEDLARGAIRCADVSWRKVVRSDFKEV